MSNDTLSPDKLGLDTLGVRAGQVRTHEQEHSEAIFTTSSYVFDDCASAAARFIGEESGNVYSRYTNPTVRTFEERLAAMEGGEAAVGTSSGMSAILATCMALLEHGDHILCSRDVFGSTTVLLNKYLAKMGISITYVSLVDIDAWRAAVTPKTKLFFLETPSNPLSQVADIQAIASLAKASNSLLAVDNCFCSPALQQPLKWGADLVIHSATKYIDGQGRCLGGAVVGSQALIADIVGFVRSCGPCMSPFNAWVFLKGLETLRIRMEAHSSSALTLATWLQAHPRVEKVYYAGLADHPGHDVAARQQRGFGGVLSFEINGGKDAAWAFINATRLMSLTANLGDAKTTIVHPATTTHGRLSPEQRSEAGIRDSLIRIAVGLEDIDDLKADLLRGFNA